VDTIKEFIPNKTTGRNKVTQEAMWVMGPGQWGFNLHVYGYLRFDLRQVDTIREISHNLIKPGHLPTYRKDILSPLHPFFGVK